MLYYCYCFKNSNSKKINSKKNKNSKSGEPWVVLMLIEGVVGGERRLVRRGTYHTKYALNK